MTTTLCIGGTNDGTQIVGCNLPTIKLAVASSSIVERWDGSANVESYTLVKFSAGNEQFSIYRSDTITDGDVLRILISSHAKNVFHHV